ncbi:chaperone modulator CbpM [Aliiroseovarius sp. PTFE2010]|uniref:chaperone modulator CbpM n=1 Tax=Aliiroseovarius sp. PTFE2010 TaxID=3417190 RepID=UPI003CF27219
MASDNELVPTGEIVTSVTLKELCRLGGCSADWVIELVDEGILEPEGPDPSVWRFAGASIAVVHRVRRLQKDLALNLAGVAIVLVLVEENAALKRRLSQFDEEAALSIWQPGPQR